MRIPKIPAQGFVKSAPHSVDNCVRIKWYRTISRLSSYCLNCLWVCDGKMRFLVTVRSVPLSSTVQTVEAPHVAAYFLANLGNQYWKTKIPASICVPTMRIGEYSEVWRKQTKVSHKASQFRAGQTAWYQKDAQNRSESMWGSALREAAFDGRWGEGRRETTVDTTVGIDLSGQETNNEPRGISWEIVLDQ